LFFCLKIVFAVVILGREAKRQRLIEKEKATPKSREVIEWPTMKNCPKE